MKSPAAHASAFICATAALLCTTSAWAVDLREDPPEGALGVTAGLEYGFFSVSSFVDATGESSDLVGDSSISSMYVNLHAEYALPWVAGLHAGLDLPLVINSATVDTGAGSSDASGTSIGDLSLFVGYWFPVVPKQLRVGGDLRFKLATGAAPDGTLADDEAATGDGSNHIQLTAKADGTFEPGITAHVDAGYILTLGTTFSGFNADVNPGDVFFANLGVGYLIEQMVEPVLVLNFASAGSQELGPEGGTLTEVPNSAANFLALGIDVYVKINPMLKAKIGWGTSQIYNGLVLDRGGLLLSGENVFDGAANFNVGVTGSF